MSYISSMLSPYRGDLEEEIGEILSDDHEMVLRDIQSRGLIFLIAYIMVMGTSLVKVLLHTLDHYSKPERPAPKIDREKVDRSTNLTYMYEMKESGGYNKVEFRTKNQEARVGAIRQLRNYLYNHNLTLNGRIIKEVSHKVDDHAFLNSIISGEEMAKFSTTYITFGEVLNKLLYEVLPTKPKKRTVQGVSCLAFENDYGFMTEELRQLYQEPVKVTFDRI